MGKLRLTNGEYVIVDDDDIEFLDQFIWRASNVLKNVFAVRTIKINGMQKTIKMQDFIMNKPTGLVVLNLNGNTLDNRRQNLKIGTLKDYYKIFPRNAVYSEEEREIKARERRRRTNIKRMLNGKTSIYYRNKRRTDVNFRLSGLLRQRLWSELKRRKCKKTKSALSLIGCSIPELKRYLELQFKENMTWDNYGIDGWHIDHIIPCAEFDLTDIRQQEQCFHYTNLQPLWAKDNMSKGKKINIL